MWYRDWDPKVKAGGFERFYQPLRLGMLNGNRFSVALRFIPTEITADAIAKSTHFRNYYPILDVENLKSHGFINYFGMQRFGTYNVRTHEIGREVLKQNWTKVIEMIIS